MITREVVCKKDRFDRAQAFTTTPAGEWGWTIADTSSAGTPTYLCTTADGGAAVLTLAATNEVENVCLFQNDVLPFDIRQIQYAAFTVSVSGVDANTVVAFGLGSARADDEDTVATNLFFKIEGAASTSALVVETDDGTTDDDDNATGTTLSSTLKKCVIDLTGGLSDVKFIVDGTVVPGSFSIASVAAGQNVQFMVQLSKASGTGTPAITISNVEVQYRTADGA